MPQQAKNMTPSSTDPPLCSFLAPTKHQPRSWLPWLLRDERSAHVLALRTPPPPNPAAIVPTGLINDAVDDPGPVILDPRSASLTAPPFESKVPVTPSKSRLSLF